jgi:2-aminoadipate transaminase
MQFARHLNDFKPSYIRTILQAATEPGVISLAGGLPSEENFPLELLQQASASVLSDPQALQYGITEGEPNLREWIVNSMSTETVSTETLDLRRDQVLISSGSQQAMDLLVRSLIDPGDGVVMEAPSYLGALQVFHLARANVVSVEQTDSGPDLNQLEAIFSQRRPKLFYTVTDFHNPTGCCWSLQTRQNVLQLAQRYGVTILEDAPYRNIRFSGKQLPSLFELAPEQVCYLGSFSKTVTPGLRLGYLCASPDIIEMVARVKQAADLHSSTLCQRLLLPVLKSRQYQNHLNTLKCDYRERRDVLAGALNHYLNGKVSFSLPEGGMFIWARLLNVNTTVLAENALKKKVAIVPGSVFYEGDTSEGSEYIRLNFTHGAPAMLEQAVERLSDVISNI